MFLVATRAEQTLYRGISEESVQTAIDAIPLDFRLVASPYPLRTPSGEWDVQGAFESVRKATAGIALSDVHVSTVALERDDDGNIYIWSVGDCVSVYHREIPLSGETTPEIS